MKKIILLSFLATLMPIPIRIYSVAVSSIVGLFLFTFFTYFVLIKGDKTHHPFRLMIYITLGVLLDVLLHVTPNIITNMSPTTNWHPVIIYSLLFYFVGIIAGYILYKSRVIYKILTILSLILISYLFFSLFLAMIFTKHSEGTYLGTVDKKIKYEFNLEDIKGQNIQLSSFKNKIVVIDFWNTQCGNCYTIMPHFSELYEKYKDNSAIEFYMVHCYDENESFTTGYRILAHRGFDIPSLSTTFQGETLKLLNIHKFPQCVIFNSNSELIFRGDVSLMKKIIKKELKQIVE